MRIVRKMLGFLLAVGLMVSAMSVFASGGGYSYNTTVPSDYECYKYDGYSKGGLIQKGTDGSNIYWGMYPPKDVKEGTHWENMNTADGYPARYDLKGGQWVRYNSTEIYTGGYGPDGSSSSDSKSALEKEAEARAEAEAAKERALQEEASREAVRLAGVASDEGFADIGDMYRASQKGMSAGEYYNNVVVSTPGIENAVTVGQGGNLVVDGQVTNMSATINKITNRAYVDSVRIDQEGTVLNVVEVSYPAVEATINFYMPSVTADMNITAVQYNAGTWADVEVAEVRDDHVVLNMKGNGVVAFIAK